MVKLVFVRRASVGSLAIRVFTASPWSHVGLVTEDFSVIDATVKHGVAERPWPEFIKGVTTHEFVTLDATPQQAQAVIEALRSQIGKGYDYLALAGIWFRTGWEEDTRWFCSELIAWALNEHLRPIFRTQDVRGVWPQHLWMMQPALVGAR